MVVVLVSFESLAVVRVAIMKFQVAVNAQSQKLEKELVTHVGIRQVVDMLNGGSFAASADSSLALKHLAAKFLPLS